MRKRCAATARTSPTCACRSSSWTSGDLVRDSEFKVFAGPAKAVRRAQWPRSWCLRAGRSSRASRSTIAPHSSPATARRGSPTSRSTMRRRGRDGLQSPILKFLSDDAIAGILERTGARTGDLLFFGADQRAGRKRCARGAPAQARPRARSRRGRLAPALGDRLPDVRMGRARPKRWARDASPVHLARRRRSRGAAGRPGRPRPRAPTTWC